MVGRFERARLKLERLEREADLCRFAVRTLDQLIIRKQRKERADRWRKIITEAVMFGLLAGVIAVLVTPFFK